MTTKADAHRAPTVAAPAHTGHHPPRRRHHHHYYHHHAPQHPRNNHGRNTPSNRCCSPTGRSLDDGSSGRDSSSNNDVGRAPLQRLPSAGRPEPGRTRGTPGVQGGTAYSLRPSVHIQETRACYTARHTAEQGSEGTLLRTRTCLRPSGFMDGRAASGGAAGRAELARPLCCLRVLPPPLSVSAASQKQKY